jgi:hypothetical protein
MKLIKTALIALVLSVSSLANAGLSLQGGTGTNGAGNIVLTNGTVVDTNNNAYFQGATTPASNWVWDSEQSNGENEQLIFTFSFSLAGFDVTTASLSGLWGIDNVGTVLLNGNLLSSLPDVVVENFNTLHAFSAGPGSNAFVSGLNVLTFDVGNRGGPGAFRASVEVTAEVSTPSVAIMFLLGLVAVASRKIYTK